MTLADMREHASLRTADAPCRSIVSPSRPERDGKPHQVSDHFIRLGKLFWYSSRIGNERCRTAQVCFVAVNVPDCPNIGVGLVLKYVTWFPHHWPCSSGASG
jgi:hypothetical protein